jgi:serine protease Do
MLFWAALCIPSTAGKSSETPDAPSVAPGQTVPGSDGQTTVVQHDDLVDRVQQKMVKIFGAGGARGLESYQSGFWIGKEGLILTSWSTVLDVSKLRVVAHDGRKFDAEILSFDPSIELALLKVSDAQIEGFEIDPKSAVRVGQRVFAVSNLFKIATGDEYCSVQKGVIMAISSLTQKRGTTKNMSLGKVYILDVMTNNPGATGGALIDIRGGLIGVIGKESRDASTGIWVNYALPIEVVHASVERMKSGAAFSPTTELAVAEKPHKLNELGMTLIPDVLPKTPVFIDEVRSGSLAELSGLKANDLILLLNDQRIDSRKNFERLLGSLNRADSFELLVQRGQELIRIQVRP